MSVIGIMGYLREARTNGKWVPFFILMAGGVLLAASLERFLLAASSAEFLDLPDPAIGIPLRYGVLILASIEALVALICLFGKRTWLQLGWLTWLMTGFVVFRGGLLWKGCSYEATCIGHLGDPLYLSNGIFGRVVTRMPFYVLLASGCTLVWLWTERWTGPRGSFSKMPCPSCGVHIRFSRLNLGQNIVCPKCQAAITLRNPQDKLKMSCFFCKGHIEFPSHALGGKFKCPHCMKEITLKELA